MAVFTARAQFSPSTSMAPDLRPSTVLRHGLEVMVLIVGGPTVMEPPPIARLVLSGNTLYGTASEAGLSGNGTIFSITLPEPQLTIAASGTNVILSWPTNVLEFTLQCTTNLAPWAAWSTVTNVPAVVNGQNTVTNPISASQQFYRLSQ